MLQENWRVKNKIGLISILVRDYDEACDYYCDRLDFIVKEDTALSRVQRWLVVSPSVDQGFGLLLVKAATEAELTNVGNQSGGLVSLFLYTEDFWQDYNTLRERDVSFVRNPKQEDYGTVAVFEDLYGNRWELIEPNRFR